MNMKLKETYVSPTVEIVAVKAERNVCATQQDNVGRGHGFDGWDEE